ncbi:hypothetical protein [Evansella clarkii]|uniref:hypothetical protein n=1 Tax=Evansella clarkii TaxID=79879 RepID=UPI0011172390|nr:hypothetical protein [Evansella clarkii]
MKGKYTKRLDDMGCKTWEEVVEEGRSAFDHLLKWDISHKNYQMLKPCISICSEYHPEKEQLEYLIDVYGDKNVVKHGQLYVTRGDYLLLYMRMHPYRRKESIISRIALANVGMLVPYVKLDDLVYDENSNQVQVEYRIVL